MLIICVTIAMVVNTIVLLIKKHNTKEAQHIQNLEGSILKISPNTTIPNAYIELESFPAQSLVQATNVHYGARPDLKKTNVGVLVSGPKKMREDAAVIGSSNLAKNMHFESISFSW
ncbi:putative ferric-chelate reductase (NADH) [Lupinus albus]|uniref:Putative ferric-chelate reductase (NADH) n=1 Tax=Lupinus albus TaxID=3870 RepID=A0A6A4P218_LUPAL|nr:putative ferric-chelate reductase (NADH) [Lupinus albus]